MLAGACVACLSVAQPVHISPVLWQTPVNVVMAVPSTICSHPLLVLLFVFSKALALGYFPSRLIAGLLLARPWSLTWHGNHLSELTSSDINNHSSSIELAYQNC
jgi:hypothetical protein